MERVGEPRPERSFCVKAGHSPIFQCGNDIFLSTKNGKTDEISATRICTEMRLTFLRHFPNRRNTYYKKAWNQINLQYSSDIFNSYFCIVLNDCLLSPLQVEIFVVPQRPRVAGLCAAPLRPPWMSCVGPERCHNSHGEPESSRIYRGFLHHRDCNHCSSSAALS